MTALVPASAIPNLPAVQAEVAVTAYLTTARDRLADALTATGPQAVAHIKAEVSTIAEMTKQLGLSKECRDDATEMVRRAEYALGKAIRKGQEEGTVSTRSAGAAAREARARGVNNSTCPPSATDIEPDFYNNSQKSAAMSQLSEGVEDEQFEEALTEAREEGNLSRANVVRKIKGKASPQTRDDRADQIERLAREGHTSRQIASKLSLTEQTVRQIARDYGIDLPADRAVGKRRRIDSNRVLSGVAESVSAAAYSIQQIEPLDLDPESATEWVDSLTESISALRKALKPIKESIS